MFSWNVVEGNMVQFAEMTKMNETRMKTRMLLYELKPGPAEQTKYNLKDPFTGLVIMVINNNNQESLVVTLVLVYKLLHRLSPEHVSNMLRERSGILRSVDHVC